MENIAFFIQNVQKIGLKCEWTIRALHKNSDLNSVLKTVIDLSKHFETKFRNSNAVQSKNSSSEEELFTGPFLKLPILFKQPSNATIEVNASVPMWKSALRKTTSGVKLTSETETTTTPATTTTEEKTSTPTATTPIEKSSPTTLQNTVSTPSTVEVKPETKTTASNSNASSTATSSKSTATASKQQPTQEVVEKKVEPTNKDVKTTSATVATKEVTTKTPVTTEVNPTSDKKTATGTSANNGSSSSSTSNSSTGNSSPREKIPDKTSPTTAAIPSKAILKPTSKTSNNTPSTPQSSGQVPGEWTKLKPTNSGNNLKEAANSEKQPEFLTNRLRPVSVKMNASPLSEALKNENSTKETPSTTAPVVEKQPVTKVEPVKDVKTTTPVTTKEVTTTPVKEEKLIPQKTTPPKEVTPSKDVKKDPVSTPQEASPNTGVSYLANLKSTHAKNVSTPTSNEVPNFKAQLKPVAKPANEPSNNTPTSVSATTGGGIFPVQLKKTNISLASLENKETTSPSGSNTKTNSGFGSPRSDSGSSTTNTSQYVANESTADSLSEDGSSVMDFDEDEEDMSNDQGISYNIKKLKDQVTNQHPSAEYLYSLYKLIEKKSVKWCTKFSDQEGGAKYLGQIITTMNEKKYRSMNEKTVQERSLKCCHALIEKGIFDPFLKNPSSVSAITFMIDSKDGIKIRIMALEILSLICTYNEQGFWTVLEGLNRYKTEKKEPRRFRDLIEFLKVEKDEKLKTFCLMLLNSLINTPQDSFIRILIRNELKQLGLETVVDKLSNDLQHDRIRDENLKEQIKVFEEEMMIGLIEKEQAGVSDDSENTTENLFKNFKSETDPLKIVKLLILRLGATTGTSHLVSILQNLLSYSMSSSMDPKFEPQLLTSWKNLDNTIKSMVQACQMKGDSGIIEDIAKKEKNASFEKQKQTSKISNLNLTIEKTNKEIDELKKQVENWKVKFNESTKNISILSNQLNNLQANKDNNAQPNDVKVEPVQQIIPIDTQIFTKEIDELKLLVKEKEDSVENVNKENDKLKDQLKELLMELEEHRRMSFKQSLQTTTGTVRSNSSNTSSISEVSNQNSAVIDLEPSFTTGAAGSGFVPPPPGASGSGFVPPPPTGASSGGSSPNIPQVPNMTGAGLPPPPPSGIVSMSKKNPLPELSKRAPKSAVKNFYGVAINRHKVSQTCWVKGGIAAESKEVQIDEDELEDLFSNAPKKNNKDEEKKRKELISFVEPQKGSALSILLGYIRLDYSEIKRAILEMDEEVLTAQVVDTLKDKMATADELSQIEAYNGDADLLSPVDKFKFQTEVSEVLSDLETVLTASTQVVQSSRFKRLLAVILAIANFLNANSSSKKNAYGFTLNSLSKLQDTKTSDNKSSLLQYISSYCEKSFPDLLNIKEDFSSLEDATRVSLVESDNEYRKLKQGFETMERELQNPQWESTTFKNNMSEFMESATRFLDDIDSILSKIDEKLKQIAEDFAEDEKTVCKNPNELFQTLNNFLNNFRNGYEELVKQREADEKKKLKQKIMEEKKKQSAAFFSNHTNMRTTTSPQDSIIPSSPPPPPPVSSSLESSSSSTSEIESFNPPTINTEPVSSTINTETLSTSTPIEAETSVTTPSSQETSSSDVMSEAEHLELLTKMRDRKKSIMSGSAFRERRMTRFAMESNEQQ
ncbi:diaphanous-related formin [Naegleria gruberi]|uniref:Diaphanous-related formin n=1 Tax=Naegleria gruberi TaxID=5762 RepID=D2W476_NAEGR|nr:diaphanous-related formin [Naegleria gruberi]EFC36125.1 diaphanous-related formin [Naegleria gruberi]|eukprot:XP_002668869.1 diaphanous-related formin [Naegleria gruberi strain NEG-M]